MERGDRAGIATFLAADEPLVAGATISLGEGAARHARVLRLGQGSPVRLLDGAGHYGTGTIIRLSRDAATVQVAIVEELDPLPEVHLLIPVADRERMLWLAEKCAECEATSWRPVLWRRSRSVRPRGEGQGFASRVRARMISALEQSGATRLPAVFPDATLDRAVTAAPDGARLLLDSGGLPLLDHSIRAPVIIAVGPEGGLDDSERDRLLAAGFARASLGRTVLRFETAALAALAIVRASLTLTARIPHAN